jgi:acetyl-CoA C-acetyltransferase
MSKVYLVAAQRTPVGSFLGALSSVTPAELGGIATRAVLEKAGVAPNLVDEAIYGHVLMAGQGQGVGRQAALAGGLPAEIPGYSINILCGSGMKSVMLACNAVKAGEANLVLAGGTESMSQAGFVLPGQVRKGHKMMDLKATDHMVNDGLTCAFNSYHMGITAENIAAKYGISRETQDAFAYGSQSKAIAAQDAGRFKDEIVPVTIKGRKGDTVVDADEYPNRKTTPEVLAKLRPAFKKDGTVTAGNASGINDGASVLLIASEDAVQKHGLTPMAEIVATGQGGVDPAIMGMGPVPAVNQALLKAGLKLTDIDLIELNEAFAAQGLGVMEELKLQHGVDEAWFAERTNVNGGAIAIGHPIGASGNRITTTLVHEMKKRGVTYGLGSLCIGGGMGTAVILKAL